ncbi:hypothetical protein H8S95_14925 [Pontibacter sp. KCTC 32443]|uniref:hypothetical protein n=1 Tax=Pontibacter TaxID=323449 RepID=UPI00164E9A63|nr:MULTISPECIES: hypothetical protein [Pontibacter]MBC5775371.1 hypothetical protein [Pontibacter sp. KCTC 32443]
MNQPQVKLGEKTQISAAMHEVFTTEAGVVYQCNKRNRLIIDFAGSVTELRVETFLRLKKAVDSIDLSNMAVNTQRCSDYELVTVCGCDKLYVLTLPEIYTFKELLGGAKFALELNSMLHECLKAQVA